MALGFADLAARALPLAWLCLACGCASIGPPTVARDRFDYVESISESWKRQMLLNVLKIRYFDAPVFLDIALVINPYSLETDIQVGGQHAPIGRGDTFLGASATGRGGNFPTITYSPLNNEKFARTSCRRSRSQGLLYLLQGGYLADVVMRICVNSINGPENAYDGAANLRPGSPFFRAAGRDEGVAGRGGMAMRSSR
jgi:hypothetical protein